MRKLVKILYPPTKEEKAANPALVVYIEDDMTCSWPSLNMMKGISNLNNHEPFD